jgi:uncharacterized protein (TIGR03545 family)
MRNLFESAEIRAVLAQRPLLEKKVVIDSVVIRNVRIDTPRKTSGALPDKNSTSGQVARQVAAWASQIRIPAFSLEGLGKAIQLPPLSIDSLHTVQQAKTVIQFTDSARRGWEQDVKTLDPRPKIDSARALVERLRTLDVRTMGLDQVTQTVQSTRSTIDGVNRTLADVKKLQQNVDSGVARIKSAVTGLDAARREDYAYARGLIKLPSLDAPDISPALFGQAAVDRLAPLLYWVQMAEKYLPPGIRARLHPGPKRARMAGSDAIFPRPNGWPDFLMRFAAIDLAIGGTGVSAGDYVARVTGLTTEPALYGQPMRFSAQRTGASVGPTTVRVSGMLEHAALPLRDSVAGFVSGFDLPAFDLAPVEARAALGKGTTELSLFRRGDQLTARLMIRAPKVTWQRLADSGAAFANVKQEIRDLLWRTVSGVKQLEMDAELRGSVTRPALVVRSNLGTELAASLRRQLGAEIQRAERTVRAKVDSLVQEQLTAARARLAAVETQIQAAVAQQSAQLDGVRKELEAQLARLTGGIPGLPKLPIKLP